MLVNRLQDANGHVFAQYEPQMVRQVIGPEASQEMVTALEKLKGFWERANRAGVTGHREFNPGWHTALDLKPLLTISEAITRAALERKESRGAQFRDDCPEKDDRFSKRNTMIFKAADGSMQIRWEPLPEMPDYLKQLIEEMK